MKNSTPIILPPLSQVDPALLFLARVAQFKLEKNFHKPEPTLNPDGAGRTAERWRQCSPQWLLGRLTDEQGELADALVTAVNTGECEDVTLEAADVMNFAAALCRNLGALESPGFISATQQS